MTKFLIVLLSSFLCSTNKPTDGGNCVRYNVSVTLKSGQSLDGIIPHGTYEPKFDFQNQEFKQFLDSIFRNDTITMYKQIHEFTLPSDYYGQGVGCKRNLYAITSEDVIKMPIKQVVKADLLSYEPCGNCASDDEQAGFYFYNEMSLIEELNRGEVELLKTEPIAYYQFWYPDSVDSFYFGYGSYQMLSYNESIGLPELQEIGSKLIKEDVEAVNSGTHRENQKRYEQLKKELRDRGVILFTLTEMP